MELSGISNRNKKAKSVILSHAPGGYTGKSGLQRSSGVILAAVLVDRLDHGCRMFRGYLRVNAVAKIEDMSGTFAKTCENLPHFLLDALRR
jgi:hypothetical protein